MIDRVDVETCRSTWDARWQTHGVARGWEWGSCARCARDTKGTKYEIDTCLMTATLTALTATPKTDKAREPPAMSSQPSFLSFRLPQMLSNLKLAASWATSPSTIPSSSTSISYSTSGNSTQSPLTTPKALPISNPFDAIPHPPAHSQSPERSQEPSRAPGQSTPMATTPPAPIPLAQPTTQLTLSPPEFTLKSSPPPGGAKTPTVSSSPPQTSFIAAYASKSSTAAPRCARGQLHVKLIEANGLTVKSPNSRPYVVVVYEQNEFVSREPIHEHEKEARGVPAPLSRQSSSSALAALNGIQHKFKIEPRQALPASSPAATANNPPLSTSAGSSSRSSSGSSGGSKPAKSVPLATTLAPAPSIAGRGLLGTNLSAMNPVWKHEVSL